MLALLLAAIAFAGEPELLKQFPKVFQRSGDTLTVFTADDSRKYQDSLEDTGEGRVKTTVDSYLAKLKVVVLRHQFSHGGTYDILSLRTGKTIHACEVAPEWFNGIFACTSPRVGIGLCDSKGCDKLIDREGNGSMLHWMGHDKIQAGEALTCKVNRRKRTAECLP